MTKGPDDRKSNSTSEGGESRDRPRRSSRRGRGKGGDDRPGRGKPQESSGDRKPADRKKSGGRSGGGRSRGRRDAPRGTADAPPAGPAVLASVAKQIKDGHFIIFDIETTGGNPGRNGITEIFALKYRNGKVEDTFYSLVNPKISIPPIVRRMTGITNQMVRDAPTIDKVMPGVLDFIGSDILVSHNTIGDMKFLRHFAEKSCGVVMENFYMCTHLLVEKLVSDAPDKSLKGLATYFKFETGDLHRAEADTYVTLDLFKELCDRLGKRGIKKIEQGIRLQGDLESAMRLGWGLTPEQFKQAPEAPGLFFMRDHKGQMLFLSSAINLSRESQKLKNFTQLPRQLLRVVLKADQISFQNETSGVAAMLAEVQAEQKTKTQYDAHNWHQRLHQAFVLTREEEGLRLNVGALKKGTIHAFGPVRDRRAGGEFVARVAEAYDLKATRKGVLLPASAEDDLVKLFHHKLDIPTTTTTTTNVGLFSRVVRALVGSKPVTSPPDAPPERLAGCRPPGRLSALLELQGALAARTTNEEEWQVYEVRGGSPQKPKVHKGDPEELLKQGPVGRRMRQRLMRQRAPRKPLTELEAKRVNAIIWWAFNSRKDCQFVNLDELAE